MEYPRFSAKTRAEDLKRLKREPLVCDALIVGGGIVGAGLARELAIRGKSCALFEKSDFASGTSSKSSKLIHGGLRYLEMFDFHLVFEALSERHWLLQTHPHLVQPLEFDLPIYEKKNAPAGARGGTLLGLGLWLYDALSLFRTPFFHGRRSAADTLKLFPRLRSQGLTGALYYADAMMLDDELVLETLLDARRRGAIALNYTKVTGVAERGEDGLYRVQVEDVFKREAFDVQAREVIVCVGPWTEKVSSMVATGAGKKLKPSKGVHLILPWSRFPVEKCLVMYAPDGRIVFAIPRKDLGPGAEQVIIGTTDSPEQGEPDQIHANADDIDYLLKVVAEYFPDAKLSLDDVTMTYSGVRPLIDSGEQSEAKTSREHEIWRNEAGIVFMAGGKYTTFRKISQELADFAFPKSKTRKNQNESRAQLSNAADYAQRLIGTPVWGKFTEEWVRWKLEHHGPCTLEDVVFRRMPLWMAGKSLLSPADLRLEQVARVAAAYFGWDAAETARQLEEVRLVLRRALTEVLE